MANETIQSEQQIDIGGFQLSLGPVITATPTYAGLSSYYFSGLGLIEKGDKVSLNYSNEKRKLEDGSPASAVYEFIIREALNLETILSELSLETLLAQFNTTATHTEGSEVDTTVATDVSNTASKFKLTVTTNVVKNRLLKVGTEKPVLVKTLDGSFVELVKALSATPADTTAVKNISESQFIIGGKSNTQYYSIKMHKEMPNMEKTLTIVIPKASVNSQAGVSWDHDEVIKTPFGMEANKQKGVIENGLAIGWLRDNIA